MNLFSYNMFTNSLFTIRGNCWTSQVAGVLKTGLWGVKSKCADRTYKSINDTVYTLLIEVPAPQQHAQLWATKQHANGATVMPFFQKELILAGNPSTITAAAGKVRVTPSKF